MDNALDAILQHAHVEVDQQAEPAAGKFEVRDQLGLVNGMELIHGFQFQDDKIRDQEIEAVAAIHLDPTVDNWLLFLSFDFQAAIEQFKLQARLVSRFQ